MVRNNREALLEIVWSEKASWRRCHFQLRSEGCEGARRKEPKKEYFMQREHQVHSLWDGKSLGYSRSQQEQKVFMAIVS